MTQYRLLILLVISLIMGCDPGLPGNSGYFEATGYAAPLSQVEFNNLPPEEQYKVANKLLGTTFRGVSVEDYFDLSAGTTNLQPKPAGSTFLDDTHTSFLTPLSDPELIAHDSEIDGLDENSQPVAGTEKYIFNSNRPRQLPLARIKEYGLSKNFFDHWMAYILANSIMFSPALEMETTDISDVQRMYTFLVNSLADDKTIRDIIRSNLPSLARWRVSRSAENHALEAYELYLGLFETEEDSMRGGIACKNLSLTDANDLNRYTIRIGDSLNTEPQLILADPDNGAGGFIIVTCDDLYDVISGHPLIIPRTVEVVINYFMFDRSLEDRLRMIGSITASNPQTFADIFTAILFSREYLLNTERPKSFEESFMPLLDILKWEPGTNRGELDDNIFNRMASGTNNQINLDRMGWSDMAYKIGRIPVVPLDGLSFGNYHKAMREELLMNSGSYRGDVNGFSGLFYNEIGDVRPEIAQLDSDEFMDFLFLSILQRKATSVEHTDLTVILTSPKRPSDGAPLSSFIETLIDGQTVVATGRHDDMAVMVFDYISRLPEFYYFRTVN